MNGLLIPELDDELGLITQFDGGYRQDDKWLMRKRADAPALLAVDDVIKTMKVCDPVDPVAVNDFDFMSSDSSSSGGSSPSSEWSDEDDLELDMLFGDLGSFQLPETAWPIFGDDLAEEARKVDVATKKTKKRKRKATKASKASKAKAEPKPKKARKPKKPKLTPEERAALKHSRMLARRERKNIREKKRRIEEKALFDELCSILGVVGQSANEKGFILAATLRSVRALEAVAKSS